MHHRVSDSWRPLNTAPASVFKWAGVSVVHTLTGTLRTLRDGKFGPVADIVTATGLITCALPTALHNDLARVPAGAEVRIEYLGLATTKDGARRFHQFAVAMRDRAIDGDEDLDEGETTPA
jgi:hypothetical protein